MANFTRIGYGQVEPNQLSGIKTGQIFASLPLDKDVEVLQNGEFMFYDYASGKVMGNPDEAKITEPYLVFQEIKIYEDWLSYKDFAMIRVGDNYVTNRPAVGNLTSMPIKQDYPAEGYGAADNVYGDGALTEGVNADPEHSSWQAGYRMDGIAPRLVKTNIGDIYTTNMVETGVEYEVGNILMPAVVEKESSKLDDAGDPIKYKTLVLSKTGTVDTVQFAVVQVYTMPDGQPGLKLQRIA